MTADDDYSIQYTLDSSGHITSKRPSHLGQGRMSVLWCCTVTEVFYFSGALFDVEIPLLYLKAEYEIFASVNIYCLMFIY